MGFGIGYCPRGVVLGVTAAYVDACLLGSWALPEAGPQHECPKENAVSRKGGSLQPGTHYAPRGSPGHVRERGSCAADRE